LHRCKQSILAKAVVRQRLIDPRPQFRISFEEFSTRRASPSRTLTVNASTGGSPSVTTCDFSAAQVA
jgi:hypothetical protein